VELGAQLVWCRRDDREAAYPLAGRRTPIFPQSGQSHQPSVGQRDRIGLLPGRDFLPLIKVVRRYEAAPPLERFAKSGLALNPLGFGVDVRETAQNGTRPQRITSKLRSPAFAS
jgi:hypothetical protein